MMKKEELYKDKTWLKQKYVEKEMTIKQITQSYGFACTTIERWLKKFNIPRRSSSPQKGEKNARWKGGPKAYGESRRKTQEYKEYQKEWLKTHPNYTTEKCRKMKQKAIEYKGEKCLICSVEFDGNNACIFDFHHRDLNKKDLSIGQLITRKWEKIKSELDKTDLMCSNCHRLIHNGGLK